MELVALFIRGRNLVMWCRKRCRVCSLMVADYLAAGLSNFVLDLGHVDVVSGVLAACDTLVGIRKAN